MNKLIINNQSDLDDLDALRLIELEKNGICCFLMTAEHNKRYDVGYKRIDDLKDFLK